VDTAKTRIGTIVAPEPNWSSVVREEYEFQTFIHEAHDGSEQRESMRQVPRTFFEFTSDSTDALARRVAADLKEWPTDGLYVLPVSWRYARLVADTSGGSPVLGLDRRVPWWMKPGTKLVLDRRDLQEVVEIESVGVSTVFLTAPPSEPFTVGDKVCLGRDVRYASKVNLASLVSRHRRATLRLDVNPGFVDYSGLQTEQRYHEGYEVFLTKPNWANAISVEFDDNRDTMDTGVGLIDVQRYTDFTSIMETMNFTLMTTGAVDEMIGFFMRQKGAQLPFWTPTRTRDLVRVGGGTAGNTGLRVEGHDFHTAYNQDEVFNTLAVQFPSGCWQLNRIESMNKDTDGNTVLTMVDKWEENTANSTICFALMSRLVGDRLVVNWETNSVAEISLTFKALPTRYMTVPAAVCSPPVLDTTKATQHNGPWVAADQYYAAINIAATGLSMSAIDRGLGFVYASSSGKSVVGSPTLINYYGNDFGAWVAGIEFGFFANFSDTLSINRPATDTNPAYKWSIVDDGDSGDASHGGLYDISLQAKIPPGARWAKARFIVQRDPNGSLFNLKNAFQVCTHDWGFGYDVDNLICP
jgi:hypothetical protein